jgi:hypothetical protein
MKRFLLLALIGCGAKKEGKPQQAPDAKPRPSVDARPIDATPIDSTPIDADTSPKTVRGFHVSLTSPKGWTEGPQDPVLPGNVMLKGPDGMTATVGYMTNFPAPKDAAGCDEAAARLTKDEVRLESATMTKNPRFGASCRAVHHDQPARQRIVSELFTVADDDMLLFMCWFPVAQLDRPADCDAIFESIQVEP